MSEFDDAMVLLEQAVARLETAAATRLGQQAGAALAVPSVAEYTAEDARRRALTAAVVARVDAALGKIGRALEGAG